MTRPQKRSLSLKQTQQMLSKVFGGGSVSLSDIRGDPTKILAHGDITCQYGDGSLAVKTFVNNFLFGGSVYNLGTEKHQKLVPSIESGELLGCFAMTEMGHGSNVRALETTATYDPETNEFVINTPKRTATKWWIGNACHAVMASVFARLILNGKDHEVHCFLVPIRKANGITPMPGVKIGDCGPKYGVDGVDNGWFIFDNVRIPYDNLLDRFGSIENGKYTSPIKSPSQRFATVLSQTITCRMLIAFNTGRMLKVLVAIATRYATKRVQFGAQPGAPETAIIEYPTHYTCLMPMIATSFAFDAVKSYLARRFKERSTDNEVHVLASGFKAAISHYCTVAAAETRRLCGGHGYSGYSRFAQIIAGLDVCRTFEGDNTLLYQQVAKDLLTQYKKEYSSNKFTGALKYLGESTRLLLSEHNPFAGDITDMDFLRHCMEFRSSRLLVDAANTVAKAYKETKVAFTAWNQSLETLVHLAKAHTETIIAINFIEAVETEKDKEMKMMLEKLCRLHILTRIREDFEFYRGTRYLARGHVNSIVRAISALCLELSKQATLLADALGCEEELINAPIAMVDGDIYEHIFARVGPFDLDNYPEEMRAKL
ncbi:hypothetical protein SAMD00019534_044470 [Acytostelium subglobosum LB1]|uniref:hypothetical protein n=1 Tax=Acytostelium subglobosum LB1 TaxID=1410327 RepID=UPI00064502B8|nr:hypothetical protein SAMD00019534_044470 [Acytostelium subglobosum LB1]GAM21272.1 hypothetical protein SAMD00019534_044470 [Acytostelium subglobosum LB1]|eukprot:XP_012755391.1 hypothetical protein SAMD00019534_044470 [Acytostelium subglobosum LB1]